MNYSAMLAYIMHVLVGFIILALLISWAHLPNTRSGVMRRLVGLLLVLVVTGMALAGMTP